ncbi:MAG TPA: asparaginase, partial [Paenisporosarcina sp.]|nr:asparaginase [Paenisporosarcina sp.]
IAQPVYGYEGGGKMLEGMGVLFAHGLSGQKARIKLLIGLSDTNLVRPLSTWFEY